MGSQFGSVVGIFAPDLEVPSSNPDSGTDRSGIDSDSELTWVVSEPIPSRFEVKSCTSECNAKNPVLL